MLSDAPPNRPDDVDASGADARSVRLPRVTIVLWLLATGMVTFFLPLYLMSTGIRGDVERLKSDLQVAQQSIEAAKTPGPELLELVNELNELKASSNTIKEIYSSVVAGFIDWPAVMSAIADYWPDRISLTALTQTGNEITVHGRASDDSDVVAYARALEGSNLFSRVVVKSIRAIEAPFATGVAPGPQITITPTLVLTPTLTATPTSDLRDEYEDDDFEAKDIFFGQTQSHNFYPLYDVDMVKFLAKAGRYYRVRTSELAPGTDTFLTVSMGSASYTNDDREPGDLSSELTFQVTTAYDLEAIVTITNRAQYGPERTYNVTVEEVSATATPIPTGTGVPTATSTITPIPTTTSTPTLVPTPITTSTPTLVPTPTVTPNLSDEYEPDDTDPGSIAVGETQAHTFYPDNDVDKLKFLAKAGRRYRVYTSNLTLGVDTLLFVMAGQVSYTNDDRQDGDASSEVIFYVGEGHDVEAIVEVYNRGRYGPDHNYNITVEEVVLTPVPTATTATLGDAYEPDDTEPRPISVGEVQAHTFYPDGDVDKVSFLAKAGRRYRVYTSDLTMGVDTLLFVTVGDASYTNDDREPGDMSSEVLFDVGTSYDVAATVEVHNRGQYGLDEGYHITVQEVVATPVPTATTAELGDDYEPDDTEPQPIIVGEAQTHTFYPDGDVDKVKFLAKAGRRYRVFTSNLIPGVDTQLSVTVGDAVHTNDDRQPGDVSSEVTFDVATGSDVEAIAEVRNRGLYGPEQEYTITVQEVLLTPAPTATSSTLGDDYEPDDEEAQFIEVGETQTHTFYPTNDVDKVKFLAKAGLYYQIFTSELALGVDTLLIVDVGGDVYINDDRDDREPGDFSSAIEFQVGAGGDVQVVAEVQNKEGIYGPEKQYLITVQEITPAPTPASVSWNPPSLRGPGLAALLPGYRHGSYDLSFSLPQYTRAGGKECLSPPVSGRSAQLLASRSTGAVEFVIVLVPKLEAPQHVR